MAWSIVSNRSRRIRRGWIVRLALASVVATMTAGWLMTSVTAAPKPGSDASQKVDRQLAFGEFAAALETAQAVGDPRERADLFQRVANAQPIYLRQ